MKSEGEMKSEGPMTSGGPMTSEGPMTSGGPMTLEQVGRIIGVTKERVRQIQNKALVKLREQLEETVLSG